MTTAFIRDQHVGQYIHERQMIDHVTSKTSITLFLLAAFAICCSLPFGYLSLSKISLDLNFLQLWVIGAFVLFLCFWFMSEGAALSWAVVISGISLFATPFVMNAQLSAKVEEIRSRDMERTVDVASVRRLAMTRRFSTKIPPLDACKEICMEVLTNTGVDEVFLFHYQTGEVHPHAGIKGFSYQLNRNDLCADSENQRLVDGGCLTMTETTLHHSDAVFSFERIQEGYAIAERYVAWRSTADGQYRRVFQESRLSSLPVLMFIGVSASLGRNSSVRVTTRYLRGDTTTYDPGFSRISLLPRALGLHVDRKPIASL